MFGLIAPSETEKEFQKKWLGNTDSNLSETGKITAINFADNGIQYIPDRFYCSPESHCIEFASIIWPKIKPQIIEEFRARSMGILTDRYYYETMNEFPRRHWLAWNRNYWKSAPGGESFFDISERVFDAFRSKILPIKDIEHVFLICSPDIIRLIFGIINHIEEENIPKISIETCIPYIINQTLT
jgi:broad specificity phosphatase PhoE